MAVHTSAGPDTPSASEKRQIVEDLVTQPILHSSEALCQLLRYLVEQSIEHGLHAPKEHQIATELFSRPTSFDPRLDSTVRVQTSRLRSKLAEYYATAPSMHRWRLEIPRGSYGVVFHDRKQDSAVSEFEPEETVPEKGRARRQLRSLILPLVGGAAIIVAALLWVQRPAGPSHVDRALTEFWRVALPDAGEPLVVFSNAEFTGRPETGLRYVRPDSEHPAIIFDQYTGVGEVMAVNQLHDTFDQVGRHFILKRGRLLNWDDTKDRDVIFLGSPSENLPVGELPPDNDFSFRRVLTEGRPGDLGIANTHPKPEEKAVYFGSKDLPITEDYALIQLSSGAQSGPHRLVLAGTTTFGTQGAVEFVCRADKLRDLIGRFRSSRQAVGPFSAVIRIRIAGGVPIGSEIVAFRFD